MIVPANFLDELPVPGLGFFECHGGIVESAYGFWTAIFARFQNSEAWLPLAVATDVKVRLTVFVMSHFGFFRGNGRWPLWVAVCAATCLNRMGMADSAKSNFAARFASPAAESRIIKIIHNWPDQPEAQQRLIRRLQNQGFGGVVCNDSFTDYLKSDAKWESFTNAVHEAKRVGMALWLYDECGYPSGNAGGLVLREHPEWEAQGLLVADAECDAGLVELSVPPGKLLLAAAFPVRDGRIDLKRKTKLAAQVSDGRLCWLAPAGRWHLMIITESRLYEGTHAEGNLFKHMPYVNLLRPEPTRRFLELTHQCYAEQLGSDLGKHFVATFTDEPSLMSCFLKPMPWRPLPWAPKLPVEFKRRRGYALDANLLPALIADAGARGARIRHDFWLTVAGLVSEHYFGQIQQCCRRLNIPSGGHLLMEESLVAHVPLYGDFFRCARHLDAPSIDCLTSLPPEVPWYIARMLASVAELDRRQIVMSETSDHSQRWRPPGDTRPKRVVTEAEIRGTCNRLMVSGVNAITSYYSFAELDENALRRLNEWVGRCCASLAGGHQVADIALLYPIESVWPKFRPARHWATDSPGATAIENTWRTAMDSLFAVQRDFTIMDSRTLAEATVKDGALVHGPLRWRALVLPGVDTLPEAAWENLARFVRAGGVVITVGALPMNSEAKFPSRKIRALGRELFSSTKNAVSVTRHGADGAGVFLPAGSAGLLPLVLDGVLDRDVTVHTARSPVRVAHRRIDGSEVYFLINDSGKSWQGDVSLSARGPGERWDPAAGAVMETNLGTRVSLNLEPYGAALLRYPSAEIPKRRTPQRDVLPNLTQRPLPQVEPALTQGEFVRAELTLDDTRSKSGHTVWRATGVLTKRQVDTFLFVRFIFPEPIDLSRADCLVFDTWVPNGQDRGNQILTIVREKSGGDFLASTGRSLQSPGHQRVFVPVSRLQLAGWSTDSDGELDLKRVDEIRIGWGGYLGTEGQRVEFSLTLPEIGAIIQAAGR